MPDISCLVHLAQSGDEKGKEALFKIASRLAYIKIAETIGYSHDADDVLQEVLFSLIQSLPKLEEPRAFFKWFKRIVSNKLADHFRKKNRNRELSNYDFESTEQRSLEQDIQSSDWDDEISSAVMTALRQLPPRSRLMVRLFYLEGLSCREVADFLFTSSQAVKTGLYRIRKKLNESLERVSVNLKSLDKAGDKPLQFQWINISGDKIMGKLFGPDSIEARLYLAAYPVSTVSVASSVAGVSEDEAGKILSWWSRYELIELEGNQIRCMFPVLLREDYDILLPWAERVAEPLVEQLEWLDEEALLLGKELPDKTAQESVRVTAILAVLNPGLNFPLKSIFKEAKLKLPERKGLGRTAVGGASGVRDLIQGYNGEIYLFSFSPNEPDEPDGVFSFINHVGTSRKLYYGNEKNAGVGAVKPLWISVIPAVLSRIGLEGIDRSRAQEVLGELLPSEADAGEWIKYLVESKALEFKKGKIRVGIPVIKLAEWRKFASYLEELGRCVCKSLEDSAMDLGSRFSKCSFAHCDYTECLLLALTLVSSFMFESIKKTCAISFPKQADFTWGSFIALP